MMTEVESNNNDDPNVAVPTRIDSIQSTSSSVAFDLKVSRDHNARAQEIKLFSNKRPHMRAFHCAWIGFFAAFFVWFSITPLLSVIQIDLGMTREQVWITTMCSDVGTVLARFIVGPLCDVFGARLLLAGLLCIVSIPTALTGAVANFKGLCALRFFIGFSGSSFVMAQFWTGKMFVKEVIGTANAIVAGWGNLGGGVTQLIMGAGLFPLFKTFTTEERAWRSIFVFPALLALLVGLIIARVSDDGPGGYFKEMKKNGTMDISTASFIRGTDSKNAWLLGVAYACTFGVEITMNNASSLYFQDAFGLSVESSAAAASIFGCTNLFARAIGGILSDKLNAKRGMQGRLLLCTATILFQGGTTIAFAYCNTLAAAIPIMIVFATFVNATEGAIFGVVPYINPAVSGSIAGIVGLGGNVGGVFFSVGFYYLDYKNAFLVMGVAAMASSLVFALVHIPGCSRLLTREGALTEFDAPVLGAAPVETTEAEQPSDVILPAINEEELDEEMRDGLFVAK